MSPVEILACATPIAVSQGWPAPVLIADDQAIALYCKTPHFQELYLRFELQSLEGLSESAVVDAVRSGGQCPSPHPAFYLWNAAQVAHVKARHRGETWTGFPTAS